MEEKTAFQALQKAVASRFTKKDFSCENKAIYSLVATEARAAILSLLLKQNSNTAVHWIVCPHLRSLELLSTELPSWGYAGIFFPRLRQQPNQTNLADPDEQAERLAVLEAVEKATQKKPVLVLLEEASLAELVPNADFVQQQRFSLQCGEILPPKTLVEQLEQGGFSRAAQVQERGQYALRGGLIDFFPWQAATPIRVEFFDEEIDQIREFDLHTQISNQSLDQVDILLSAPPSTTEEDPTAPPSTSKSIPLSQWIDPKKHLLYSFDCPNLASTNIQFRSDHPTPSCSLFEAIPNPLGKFEAGDFLLQSIRQQHIKEQLQQWQQEDWLVLLFCQTKGEQKRLLELEQTLQLGLDKLNLHLGPLQHGFTLPQAKVALLTASELFGRYQGRSARRRYATNHTQNTRNVTAKELRVGEFVVHLENGIAKYRGISKTPQGEVLILEYANQAKLKVPLSQSHLVSRYVGLGKTQPQPSKLGEASWRRTVSKTQDAVMDYAAHLLEVQAQRKTQKGFAHLPDNHWQNEFESSFPYRETTDQLRAIEQVKKDMESELPMDRLLCGDVGFGKTEVALRAAFKAVMSGTQVALLCPTTVLAQQHWQTFRKRLSDYPIRVDLLNRFRSPKQQRETLQSLKKGEVDILIGTHRLLSKDIHWKKLGLAVVDEEQRFGVRHKERFKEIFQLIDLLTLSATPIPRTLYQGMVGVRDMSTLESPPLHRHSVKTSVSAYDEKLIKKAIELELERDGQVFFLHNRVESIHWMANKIQKLVPHAKIAIGHGQMEKNQLEEVMQSFLDAKADILISTTIIETGIDIPNANTIFIDRADRFGLADLYQLRGRVGRSHHQGYAYLLLPEELVRTEAKKRVAAIRQYSKLGDGLRIAMRDLEIRGAGNLLGTQQSGHITQVGFELYCQLLKQSMNKLQGKASASHSQVRFKADFLVFGEKTSLDDAEQHILNTQKSAHSSQTNNSTAAFSVPDPDLPPGAIRACLPATWIQEALIRLRCYRELAEVSTHKELQLLYKSWKDRFGALPLQVEALLLATEIKLRAAKARIEAVEIEGHKLKLRRNGEFLQPNGKFPRLKGMQPFDVLQSANSLLKQL